MEPNNQIKAAGIRAFQKCATKAHLLATGKPAPSSYFVEMDGRIISDYKNFASQNLFVGIGEAELSDFDQILINQKNGSAEHYADCSTAVFDLSKNTNLSVSSNKSDETIVPILFVPWDKTDLSDSELICFGALALAQRIGTVSALGTIIYGDAYRRKTVKIEKYVKRTLQIIDAIRAFRSAHNVPTLVLNRHCAVCDFQQRCRRIATERDDLSLLTAMTDKERAKCAAKGIFTITQLSYGYRPRRRKRTRSDTQPSKRSATRSTPPAKNDHKLKALAIKKNQVHVMEAPSLIFGSLPVFLDVEGMPDRGFYYLIGLRFDYEGESVERSFWADRSDGEREIWENCLRTLKRIEKPQIVSYGAYEIRFLKHMRERYGQDPGDVELVDQLIKSSINLVNRVYGKVYFPTFSNSLKEVARYLGFEWAGVWASGAAAPLLRRAWELRGDDRLKINLINYNLSDCKAAALVAAALQRIDGGVSECNAVNVSSLEVSFQHTFGKLDCALPEFKKINEAAYWDYQRSKIYARTDKTVRRSARKSRRRIKSAAVEKKLVVDDVPDMCIRCRGTRFRIQRRGSQVTFDLKFTRRGIRRWATRYLYRTYRCSECRLEANIYSRSAKFGSNLQAFIGYLLIELRLSHQQSAEHVSSLFDLSLTKTDVTQIKSSIAQKYSQTYQGILGNIAKGKLVHADETKCIVNGEPRYIWIFANLTSVAYVYSETRDSAIVDEVLDGFRGVLVSNFYAVYDSVPCAKQKCLIHLMRDINEDLHKIHLMRT